MTYIFSRVHSHTYTHNMLIYYVDIIYVCSLQLKVDKIKLIELCGTSESEFSSVSNFYLQLISNVMVLLGL